MSVKTSLTLEEINLLSKKIDLEFISIENSASGISDSVYILTCKKNTKYILKLYENSRKTKVKKEFEILKKLTFLKISNPIYIFENYDKPLVLYSFIEGLSPKLVTKTKLKEVALFLKSLHKTKIENINSREYTPIESLITEFLNINNLDEKIKAEFLNRIKNLENIDLDNNQSIIHGDIFPDNTKFKENKLMGVYDFSEVCISNRYIDLATVINSWCFQDDLILDNYLAEEFLKAYETNLDLKFMGKYLLYVNLYFALKRYISLHKNLFIKKVSYKEYLKKFDNTFYILKK